MENNIAVIVLNYNNYNDTIICTDNMLRKNVAADIVIVDNNSSNESYQVLSDKYKDKQHIHIVKNAVNSGYAAGNNVGFRYILEKNPMIEYVCIMNPDTLFDDRHLLENLSDKLAKYEDVAVIAPVMVQQDVWDIKHTYWDIPNSWDLLRRQFVLCRKRNQAPLRLTSDKTAYVGVVHGSFLMIRVQSLIEIGFLDEGTFLYSEENMLALDMQHIGKREMLSLTDVFYHNHRKSTQRLTLKRKLQVAQIASSSRKCICRKYYSNYLILIMNVLYCINLGIITLKHIGGSLKKR